MCDCHHSIITNISEAKNNETCLYVYTQEEHEIGCLITNILDYYGQLAVCGCGLFFNTITILLFLNKKLSAVLFNRLLLCLSIVDNIYLIITILEIWLSSSQNQTFDHQRAFYFVVVPIRRITMCCTIYMTVILTWERYNSTARPQVNPPETVQASWIQVLKFVGPGVIGCTLFKIPTFFEFDIEVTNGTFNKDSILVSGPWIHASSENTYNISVSYTHLRAHET